MTTGDLPPRPTVRVRVAILLVPHGIAENGDMLVGMQLSPVPDGAPGAPNTPIVDLVNWPLELRAKLANLTVHLGAIGGPRGVTPSNSIGPIAAATRWSDRAAAAADRLWQETFNQTSSGDQAKDLCEALKDDIQGARSFAARSGIAPLIDSHLLSGALATDYRHRVMTEVSHGKAAADRLGVQGTRLRRWSPPGSALGGVGVAIEELELKQRHDAYQNALRSYRGPQLSTFAANTITSQIKRGTFSLAQARARYRAEELDGSADPSVGALLKHLTAASGGDLDHAIEELAIARNIHREGIRTLDYPGDKDRARRKFSSILTSPAIATFLGVNAELRIPRGSWDQILGPLDKVAYGAIGVSFDGTVPTSQGWTAFVHGGEGGPGFFGPCDEAEALGGAPSATAAIVGGLVRLRVNQGSAPRYVLDVTDTVASTARRVDFATQALGKLRSGEAPTGSEPNPVGRGLTLVDKAIHPATQTANARARQLQASPGDHINFAADLLHGYAVMFAIPRQQTPSLKSRPGDWRTAVGRSLSFRSAKQIDPTFIAECVSFERGFGIVDSIPVTQDTHDENGTSTPVTSTPQELFSWHGGSLTVAQPTETIKASAAIRVSQDLAVSRRFDLPDVPGHGDVDYRPPPLRDGRRYLVGLAATYVGGWSLSVQDAAAAHAEDRYGHVLGDPLGKPFEFRRPDKLPAPLVLLPSGSRMVTARSEKDLLGESLMTIVVRTGDTSTATSRRFLFPHAVDFDRAEQQDQFRGVRDDEPAGAFRSGVGVLWRRGGGSFPLAMNGGIATSPRAKLGNSRGQVLKFKSSEKQRREYHPDGNSQFLRLHLGAQIPADLIPPAMKGPAPFWVDGQRPRHAMPVLLEVRRTKSDPGKARVTLEHGKEYVDGVEVRSIVISMQPATTIAVAAVAEPLPIIAVRQHMFGDVLKEHIHPTLTGAQSLDDAAAAVLATMLAQQVVSTLNGVQSITLVHAQQRPAPPAFILDDGEVTPVIVTVAADSSTTSDRKWIDVVRDRWAAHHTGYNRWESEEGGATCFFVGCVDIDPAATGKLRCEAQWDEHGPEYVKQNKNKLYRYVPGSGNAPLFSLSDIDSSMIATRLDLLRAPLNPRHLAHSFADGRARRLRSTLVATSRFTDYFRRPEDCESKSREHDIWLPCTFTPPPPTVANVSFMLEEDYRCDGRGRYSFTRTSRVRLELGTDVFASGEGEKIGVLFRVDGTDPCDLFTPALESYADGFSMEGSNPLHQSPTRGHLTPDRFRSGGTLARGVLKAQRPNDDPNVPNGVRVDILPHEPVLDDRRGFYCDIVLDPQNATQRATDLQAGAPYMPFVHLGLARYQEHAVDGLQLSHAISRDFWLLPWRHGSIEFFGTRNFTIRIEGPMVDEDPETAPTFEILVLHNEVAGAGRHLWGHAAGPSDQLYVAELRPVIAYGRAVWQWSGRLPHSRRLRNYGIRLREVARQRDDDTGRIEKRKWTLNTTIDLWADRTRQPVEIVDPLPKSV